MFFKSKNVIAAFTNAANAKLSIIVLINNSIEKKFFDQNWFLLYVKQK